MLVRKLVLVMIAMSLIFSLAIGAKEKCGEGCCMAMKDVKVTATNIENGVEIKFVGQTSEAVKLIQEKLSTCSNMKGCDLCSMKGVKREVKKSEDGAVMLLTAKSSSKIKKLQEKVKEELGENSSSSHHSGCSKDQQKKCGAHKH